MSERPLLVFPVPLRLDRERKSAPFKSNLRLPDMNRQHERLKDGFERLWSDLQTARLQMDAGGGGPQRVLVITTVGAVDAFVKAARNLGTGRHLGAKLPGLEWLADWASDEVEPDDDFYSSDMNGQRSNAPLDQRLYLVGGNIEGLERLLRLWRGHRQGADGARDSIPACLAELFLHIRELRWWGPEDRIAETGVLANWQETLRGAPLSPKLCEVEIWASDSASAWRDRERRIEQVVRDLGGRVVSRARLSEIRYHALLVEIPAVAVQRLVSGDVSVSIVRCDDVALLRPNGHALWTPHEAQGGSARVPEALHFPAATRDGLKRPIVAILDGFPVVNHPALAGRVEVDNFLGLDPPVHQRRHGTAVASLAVHGDLNAPTPISRRLLVIPVMAPVADNLDGEGLTQDRLAVDTLREAIERCIHRSSASANGHDIRLFHLALGDRCQPMLRGPSAWARLLDWLAWKHKVLFIVAAGNVAGLHDRDIQLDIDAATWRAMSPADQTSAILATLYRDARHRSLWAPAEAMNALTIGALHADFDSRPADPGRVDPGQGLAIPALYSAMGPGVRGAIKPDLLLPGGRAWLQAPLDSGPPLVFAPAHPGGMLVAAPARLGTNATWDHGTSYAAPLAVHAADAILDVLEAVALPNGAPLAQHVDVAVLVKAMLVHGATQRPLREPVEAALRASGRQRVDSSSLCPSLGYGRPDVSAVLAGHRLRAVVLQLGRIEIDRAHDYLLPIPAQVIESAAMRRLTVTLAYLTPIRPASHAYRGAQLKVEVEEEAIGTKSVDVDQRASQKGTLEHRVFEGRQVPAQVPGELRLRVVCREVAGLGKGEQLPYAIVVTLEALQEVDVDLHAFVKQGIEQQVRQRAGTRVPVRSG